MISLPRSIAILLAGSVFASVSARAAAGKSDALHFPDDGGGPSHIGTFDPKPELAKRHLQVFTRG